MCHQYHGNLLLNKSKLNDGNAVGSPPRMFDECIFINEHIYGAEE